MLTNLQDLYLNDNKLTSIPESIKIFTKISHFILDESAYDINNLSIECEVLLFTNITNNIINLPPTLKTLYLKSNITPISLNNGTLKNK